MQVNPSVLTDGMKLSKTYHLICTPLRCIELVKGIMAERKAILEGYPALSVSTIDTEPFISKPVFVWEPMEGSCRPVELDLFFTALKYVDVFSPNEHELASLFKGAQTAMDSPLPAELLARYCKQLLVQGIGDRIGAVVIR